MRETYAVKEALLTGGFLSIGNFLIFLLLEDAPYLAAAGILTGGLALYNGATVEIGDQGTAREIGRLIVASVAVFPITYLILSYVYLLVLRTVIQPDTLHFLYIIVLLRLSMLQILLYLVVFLLASLLATGLGMTVDTDATGG